MSFWWIKLLNCTHKHVFISFISRYRHRIVALISYFRLKGYSTLYLKKIVSRFERRSKHSFFLKIQSDVRPSYSLKAFHTESHFEMRENKYAASPPNDASAATFLARPHQRNFLIHAGFLPAPTLKICSISSVKYWSIEHKDQKLLGLLRVRRLLYKDNSRVQCIIKLPNIDQIKFIVLTARSKVLKSLHEMVAPIRGSIYFNIVLHVNACRF